VPQHLILELPMSSQEFVRRRRKLLEAETRMILEKARRENRPLDAGRDPANHARKR